MKKTLLIMVALIAISFLGCTTGTYNHQNREVEASPSVAFDILGGITKSTSFQTEIFSKTFRELLLSDGPLDYEKSHSLLNWVADLERNGSLSIQDKSLVVNKLKQFLARSVLRQINPGGGMSGIAPPEGVLRAYAVKLLGKLGCQSDISFLEKLCYFYQVEHLEEFSHPCFIDNCNEAIANIRQ